MHVILPAVMDLIKFVQKALKTLLKLKYIIDKTETQDP